MFWRIWLNLTIFPPHQPDSRPYCGIALPARSLANASHLRTGSTGPGQDDSVQAAAARNGAPVLVMSHQLVFIQRPLTGFHLRDKCILDPTGPDEVFGPQCVC